MSAPGTTEYVRSLTVAQVVQTVRSIKAVADAGDDERAHSMEDDLMRAVLGAVAIGHPQGQAMAIAALMTAGIDFHRWCA